jgi:hypothetical protein
VTINGTYVVLTVESTTSITFTAAQTATSAAGPTASTVDITTYLAPGNVDGLYGYGYGTGAYGSGGYGGGTTGFDVFPRTWSFDQWNQNLLSNPRGGAIYEWAPNVTSTELVTNGTFATTSNWTLGTGWSISGGAAVATIAAASDLSQSINLSTNAWHLLSLNVTRAGGVVTAKHGTATIQNFSSTGLYRIPFFSTGGAETLAFSKDTAFTGTLDNISVQVLTTAQAITNAPTQVTCIFVTAEGNVVACGSNLLGTFNPLQLDWSDSYDNQTWVPTNSNVAGGYTLTSGSRIVRGRRGENGNPIWTLSDLWVMRFNGNPGSVYDVKVVGSQCGLIGPNAEAMIGGVWYWMTPTGAFFAWDGTTPTQLPCSLSRDVADHLAYVQQDKVYAVAMAGKNYAEIWWFYPDIRDGNECSRYVIFDTIAGTWCCGRFNRSAMAEANVFQYPIAADTSGYAWFHEKDFSEGGAPRSWSLTGAYITVPGQQITVNGIKPDSDDLQGGYAYTFFSEQSDTRGKFSRTYPALNVNSSTGKNSCRVKGELVGFSVNGNAAPSYWRMGMTQFDVVTGAG